MSSRRNVFTHLEIPFQNRAHVGLWLDKFIKEPKAKEEPKRTRGIKALKDMIRDITQVSTPEGYNSSFLRWRNAMMRNPNVLVLKITPLGRTVVGLGEKGVTEIGLSLDHTWGVPYIPGSALKGLMAHTAHHIFKEDWKLFDTKGKYSAELFGDTDEQGLMAVLDAKMIPTPGQFIFADILTSHHQQYYTHTQKTALPPPSDMDSPNPVNFVSTACSFLVAIECADLGWRTMAQTLLEKGLLLFGVGAKTNAGYGRFKVELEQRSNDDNQIIFDNLPIQQQLEILCAENSNQFPFLPNFKQWMQGGPVNSPQYRISVPYSAPMQQSVRDFVLENTIVLSNNRTILQLLRYDANSNDERLNQVSRAILRILDIGINAQVDAPNQDQNRTVTFGNQVFPDVLLHNLRNANGRQVQNHARAIQSLLNSPDVGNYTQESILQAIALLDEKQALTQPIRQNLRARFT